MRRTALLLAVAAVCLSPVWFQTGNAAPNDQLTPATQLLFADYPGVRVQADGGNVHAIYGVPMASGLNAEEAASVWLERHAAALGVSKLDLELERTHEVGVESKFTIFAYNQKLNDLPVEGGLARILVLNDSYSVVYVGAKLAQEPRNGFAPVEISAEEAIASMQNTESFAALTEWSGAELVVFYGEADVDLEEAVQAWKISAHNHGGVDHEAYTMFIDANDGSLVYLRDDVHNVDVNGNSAGMATPGTFPDTASNPETSMPLPNHTVNITGGNSATTLLNGNFTIPNSGSSPVTVTGNLVGPWASVFTDQGSRTITSVNVTPPGPANLLYNSAPAEFHTAQVNTFIHTTNTHNFFKDRQPGFTALDISITCNTNLNSSCNAFYSSANQSINFYNEAGGCVNTAYTTVVAHEYGHFIVNRLGLGQGSFGEGFGDCMSLMQYDDPILGRDFFGPGTNVRDPLTSNIQYPCGSAIHTCGMVLGGSWYRIRQNFGTKYGSMFGLQRTQQLLTDWAVVTVGGIGNDAAHPTTAIEVLTLDDDDGNLANGTPNYTEICDAYAVHNIDCPELPPILFTYPNGLPTTLAPSATTTIDVEVSAGGAEAPVPGTGTVSYRVNGGGFTTVAMNETSTNVYEATLPAGACFDVFDFYFTVDSTAGGTVSDPENAPASSYSATVVTGATEIFADDFQTNQGWTVVNESLADGPWQRGNPAGDGTRGDPLNDGDGSGQCYLTDNVAGNSDVDGGPTRLLSPTIDMSSGDGVVSYYYWMYNDDNDDSLVVEVSNNNGASWVPTATYTGGLGGWNTASFTVGDFVVPTATVRLRFSVADQPNDSVTEAAVDGVAITMFTCDDFVDCNNNGTADDIDIMNGTSQDCNSNGIPDECDITDGFSEDCNSNNIPDECDIQSGFSLDANGNGIPDECDGTITFCGIGATNLGCGLKQDNLKVNGSTGGATRSLTVSQSTALSVVVDEPVNESGDGNDERLCVYAWFAAPTASDDVLLPKNLGNMCFGPFQLATRPADVTYNSIGAPNKLGVHDAPTGPARIPNGGSLEVFSYPSGFGIAAEITFQGVVQDVCTQGDKDFSVTNAVLVNVQ